MMACEQIENLMSWEMISISDVGSITIDDNLYPHQEVWFPNSISHKLFYICLLDLYKPMNKDVVGDKLAVSVIDGLIAISENPLFSKKSKDLKDKAVTYKNWLEEEVDIPFYSNIIETDIVLKIKRAEMIDISANISKHSLGKLNINADKVVNIMKRSGIDIGFVEGLLSLEDFYNQFHQDILLYYPTKIVKMLSDIRNTIFDYLTSIYDKTFTPKEHPTVQNYYVYQVPAEFSDKNTKHFFCNLMNWYRSYKNRKVDIQLSPLWKRY